MFLALADDNHTKTRIYALDSLHCLVNAAKKMDKIDADTINNITRGIVFKEYTQIMNHYNNSC